MKLTRLAAAVLAGTAAFAVSPAFAGNTVGAPIHVGVTVVDECTISTSDISFPDVGIVNLNDDTTATIHIECTKHTPYAIGLDGGGADDTSDRVMMNADTGITDPLHYQLYSDSYTTVWGNVVGTDTVDSDDATGLNEDHVIYARIPSKQNVPVGDYADTVTATIWYADDATP